MARKNGTRPGAYNPIFVGLALLAAFVMAVVDALNRPVLASVAYGMTVFVTVSVTLAGMPAFVQSLPSIPETLAAAFLTLIVGSAGGLLVSRTAELLQPAPAID